MKICIYGASGDELAQEYFDAAQSLGRLIAEGGHSLVFGGGSRGLMGACARGALSRGGEIVGVAPRFFDEPGILYPEPNYARGDRIYTEPARGSQAARWPVEDMETAASGGFLSRGCFGLFALCETPEEALRQVCAARPLSGSIRRLADYTKN